MAMGGCKKKCIAVSAIAIVMEVERTRTRWESG
jgi:hypothetical protein